MKKPLSIAFLALALVALLSSFMTAQELVGKWRWLYVINAESGDKLDIGQLTMGMASEVRTEFKADGTCLEQKTKASNGKVSTVPGAWKLESEGTVLNMEVKGEWTPSRIIRSGGDTLVVAMMGPMQLVMVKER